MYLRYRCVISALNLDMQDILGHTLAVHRHSLCEAASDLSLRSFPLVLSLPSQILMRSQVSFSLIHRRYGPSYKSIGLN